MKNMKIGDLLTDKHEVLEGHDSRPLLIVLEIRKHPDDPARDRVGLRWLSRNGGRSLNGELSRLIVENRYKVI